MRIFGSSIESIRRSWFPPAIVMLALPNHRAPLVELAFQSIYSLMGWAICLLQFQELNWRPANSSRRIVLITTDGLFHMAGDGKVITKAGCFILP